MSAAPLFSSASTGPRRSRPRTDNRQALAFRAGEDALARTHHSVGLLLYYKHLVARCGSDTSVILRQAELATALGVSTRTIRRYDDHLVAAGLIRVERAGTVYRRRITAYDAEPAAPEVEAVPAPVPEVVAVEPDPFGASECGHPCPVNADTPVRLMRTPLSGSIYIDRSRVNQEIRPPTPQRGNGGGSGDRGIWFGREEPIPETPAVQLLRSLGTRNPATLRRLAERDVAEVELAIQAARDRGGIRDLGAFVPAVLLSGGPWQPVAVDRGRSAAGTRHGPPVGDVPRVLSPEEYAAMKARQAELLKDFDE